jgi:hypothetical protein
MISVTWVAGLGWQRNPATRLTFAAIWAAFEIFIPVLICPCDEIWNLIIIVEDESLCVKRMRSCFISQKRKLSCIRGKKIIGLCLATHFGCVHETGICNEHRLFFQIIPKGIATPGLLAHILTARFADALPFYRQERQFSRLGIELPRATMCNWAIKVAGDRNPALH